MSKFHRSKIREELINLNLISESTLELFSTGTRDAEEILVFRDRDSGIIFHDFYPGDDFYESTNGGFDGLGRLQSPMVGQHNSGIRFEPFKDSGRRVKSNLSFIANRHVLDFGCGEGQFLRDVKDIAKSICGIELNNYCRDNLIYEGFNCRSALQSGAQVDTVTMFHSLEHTPSQVDTLRQVYDVLEASPTRSQMAGVVVIEVPHARDFLLNDFNLDTFRKFTLRSDHCVLHTRHSLMKFMRIAGFTKVYIQSIQRYPLSNHLSWLARNIPGGHVSDLSVLDSETLSNAYQSALSQIDATDTLVGIGFVDKTSEN